MNNSFYSKSELESIGFMGVGENVSISKKASIYSANNITIGNNVRIDDFCILSGKINLGNYIHISAYTALYGGKYGIIIEDFATISGRNMIYAESDDYSGESMTNPMVQEPYRKTYGGQVKICKHAIIGAGNVILPNIIIAEGASVGAMSFVNKTLDPWTIYAGIPCKKLKLRSMHLLDLETEFIMLLQDDGSKYQTL